MTGRWRIRTHLAALVAVATVPLAGFGAVASWAEFAEARHEAEGRALSLSQAIARNVTRYLRDAEAVAARLAADPAAVRLDPRRCPANWAREIASLPAITNVATVDLRGAFVCSAPLAIGPTARRATPQSSPWFRVFRDGPQWVVGDVQLGGLAPQQVSVLAFPVRDASGRAVAALTLTLDARRFRDPWLGVPLPAGAFVTVVDGAGTVVARSVGAGHWAGRQVTPAALAHAVRPRRDTVLSGRGPGGARQVIGASPVARASWSVVVGVSIDDAYAGAHRESLALLGLAAFFLPLVVGLAFATARSIVDPLRALGASMRAPGAGPPAELAQVGPPELREFIAAYNAMDGDRVAAERSAEAERRRMHTVASLAPVGIFHVSAEGRALFVNEQMRRITGLTEMDAPRDLRQALHPADNDRVTTAWLNAMRDGAPFRAEYRFRHADGSVVWVQGRAVPERDAAGTVIGMIGTLVDITDQVRAATDLNVAYARVRSLLAQIESARELERARIARELHDQLGQLFVALRMDLGWLERSDALSSDARERIAAMRDVMDRGVQDTRRLSRELRPSVLDDLGLVPALRWLADDFSQRSGVACETRLPGGPVVADPDRATAVFRIVQEALTNIGRHAHAREVLLVFSSEGGKLAATVTDDGTGFDPAAAATRVSYGLLGMQERAVAFGGQVAVWSAPGRGTTVAMEIPATAVTSTGPP